MKLDDLDIHPNVDRSMVLHDETDPYYDTDERRVRMMWTYTDGLKKVRFPAIRTAILNANDDVLRVEDIAQHMNGELYTVHTHYNPVTGIKIREQRFLSAVPGIRHGLQVEYHANGKPRVEKEYIQGIQHGIQRRFDENGNQIAKSTFSNDMYDGVCWEVRENDHHKNIKELALRYYADDECVSSVVVRNHNPYAPL